MTLPWVRRPTDSSPDLVVTEIIVMIGRRRPKEEHPELFLPLVTHADVRATCGLRGSRYTGCQVVERRVLV